MTGRCVPSRSTDPVTNRASSVTTGLCKRYAQLAGKAVRSVQVLLVVADQGLGVGQCSARCFRNASEQRPQANLNIRVASLLLCSTTLNTAIHPLGPHGHRTTYHNITQHHLHITTHARNVEHAGNNTVAPALTSVIRLQIATFSRLLRPTTTGSAVATLKYPHHNRMFHVQEPLLQD